MGKRPLLAIVAIIVAWGVMDFILHGLLLAKTYADSAALWRPQAEMKMGLMYGVLLISASGFVTIYHRLVADKCVSSGVQFGWLMGIVVGAGMGFGTYSVQPIPLHLAVAWFLGTLAELTTAGLLVGLIDKENA